MSDGLLIISLLPAMVAYFAGLSLFFMLKDKFTSRNKD
jgi:hypothetical protein